MAADGSIWYTHENPAAIIKLDPNNPSNSVPYPVPNGHRPFGIAADQKGMIWFTDKGNANSPGLIGRLDPNSGITEFTLPSNLSPQGITITHSGVAFTIPFDTSGNKVNAIGVLKDDMTGFQYHPVPANTILSGYIALGPDGNVWFPESVGITSFVGQIGFAHSTDGVWQGELPTPTSASGPDGITPVPVSPFLNELWFTEWAGNKIGKIVFPFQIIGPTAPSEKLANQVFQVIFQAVDNSTGAVMPGYHGTVHFTSSDPQATLPPDYTFTDADQGVHAFTFSLRTAGSQTITVTDAAAGKSATTSVKVVPAGAATLTLSGLPANLTAGNPAAVTATLRDPYGNVATGYKGTVSFTSSDPLASLPPAYTFTPVDQGVHVFAGVVLRKAGGQSVTATDTANPALAGKQTTLVSPAAPAQIVVAMSPSHLHPGSLYTVTAAVQDAYGNLTPSYAGHVHFAATDPDPRTVLPPDYQFTPADGGTHTFPNGVALFTGGPQTISVADIMTPALHGSLSVLVDIFHPPTPIIPVGQVPNAVVTADLNGDGKLDLVTVNPGDGTLSVLLGKGDGTFFPPVPVYPPQPMIPWQVAVADLNGDGIPDLVVGYADSSVLTVLFGAGDGTFVNPLNIDGCPGCPGPVLPSLTTVADPSSGATDIVMTDFGATVVSVLAGNGDGTFQPPVLYPVGEGPSSVAAFQWGAGLPALAVTNYGSGTLSVLLGNPDGTYQPAASYATPEPAPWSVAVADVNGDGIPDLLVVNAHPPNPCHLWTWLGQGNGTFQLDTADPPATCPPPALPHPPVPILPPEPIVVGDFNHDGKVDVALPDYADNSVWVSLGNGKGGFASGLLYGAGAGPVAVAAADFNGDGLLDLAVANSQDNTVSILLNQQVPVAGPSEPLAGAGPDIAAITAALAAPRAGGEGGGSPGGSALSVAGAAVPPDAGELITSLPSGLSEPVWGESTRAVAAGDKEPAFGTRLSPESLVLAERLFADADWLDPWGLVA
jgi:streptogramin lyase